MSELATGMLVQHASLGVGKIVAVEPTAVHVFFPDSEKRFAAKLQLSMARTLLRSDGVERNAWLEGLSSFALDPVTRRYALAANWVTHEQAIADFRATYPRGFLDPAYIGNGSGKRERASRWRAASAAWTEGLGEGRAEKLLEAGDVRELIRRALVVEKHVVLVPGTFEAGALTEAFGDEDLAEAFFDALLGVLSVPSPARARFDRLFAATLALDTPPALAWPLATLFPFLAEPARQVFLWPRSACGGAERLGCDLRFDPAPNWRTYAALRSFAAKLLEELQPSGARDFVDVEAFLHATATTPARDRGEESKATRRPRAAKAAAAGNRKG
ncbi:hypothetical protein [Anaeromyxobacter oryzae]|uniref:Uncharacterized protein n=1 Tax=Anaeromyxobacter oryzae TaxID=2918170 RepID=A0ABM7WYV9_9BACT|nr:hypothetical protein [Anaeromyxobacter oryzae]BDG04723.1 hypothetical protein AMOR_37190 [Anaeromyxobacter oryzae]